MGRFFCNTTHEALKSAGIDVRIGAPPLESRPFDVIVIGGGTFGWLWLSICLKSRLRICLGGSLEWGGWSPELLKEELPDCLRQL